MTTATEQVLRNDQWRALNMQIRSQLKANGFTDHKGRPVKSIESAPESEWKLWLMELIKQRNELGA